jgi:DNA-directed RNA polymerase specialized sigma subunit
MKVEKNNHLEIHRLYTQERKTLKEIGAQYGLSIGRVSQIIKLVRKQLENQSN